MRLLGNLFPCRAGGGDLAERVYPYHKSVLDWLTSTEGMDSGEFHVDTTLGHTLLAAACQREVLSTPPTTSTTPAEAQGLDASAPASLRAYALRYAVEHTCLAAGREGRGAGGVSGVRGLAALLLDIQFWGAVHAAGVRGGAGGLWVLRGVRGGAGGIERCECWGEGGGG